ncbi:hypothetical protein HYH03_012684 [Edaphochlamys debaryana]|uniref:Uncharacterized protein n=1 Tax=Edaphochlamys debaryana TaxID=47281 RepID=A0A836BV50_9CHLO|nr:hypothetical protein HYH03_012684 [Edaphochlamys debaryana]|eukprot:KAG2488683.1 hypothetical protein HYH03_012684 [Edaphochlamys debaryana]
MATVARMSSGCHKSFRQPRALTGAPTLRFYRRSTTNKAPRKRTFLVTMEKHSARFSHEETPSSIAASAMAANGGACICLDGTGGSGIGGGKGGFGGSSGNGWGWSSEEGPQRRVGHALVGALALTLAAAIFPGVSQAMARYELSSSAPTRGLAFSPEAAFGRSSSPGTSPSRPRTKVAHVPVKGSTLVVPLPADGKQADSPLLRGPRVKVVHAPIELSAREAALVDSRQYRVRESLLV